MKPINLKNILAIGLLLSIIPTYSMLPDQDLTEHLLTDDTELREMRDHVVINVDGTSSNESSPAKSAASDEPLLEKKTSCLFRFLSSIMPCIWRPLTSLPTKVKNWWDSLDEKQKGRLKATPFVLAAIGNDFYAFYVQDQFYPIPIAMTCAYEISGYLELDKFKWKTVGWGGISILVGILQAYNIIPMECYTLLTATLVVIKSIRDTVPDGYSKLSASQKEGLQKQGITQLAFNKMDISMQGFVLSNLESYIMEEGEIDHFNQEEV